MTITEVNKPLIRWAGSKRKLIPVLKENFPPSFKRYVEPFCGSACLFFSSKIENGILSDINEELINALDQIKNNPNIYSHVTSIPGTKEEYYRLRSLRPDSLSKEERAVRFLYLNRYCFNGVYRTNKDGNFNVPRGSRTGAFPARDIFETAKVRLKSITLKACDYRDTLRDTKEGDFVYMDPPYTLHGKFTGEYGLNSFNSENIDDFIDQLAKLNQKGVKFLFSYREDEELQIRLEKNFNLTSVPVKRHISGFKKNWQESKEILVKNYV